MSDNNENVGNATGGSNMDWGKLGLLIAAVILLAPATALLSQCQHQGTTAKTAPATSTNPPAHAVGQPLPAISIPAYGDGNTWSQPVDIVAHATVCPASEADAETFGKLDAQYRQAGYYDDQHWVDMPKAGGSVEANALHYRLPQGSSDQTAQLTLTRWPERPDCPY